MKTFFLSTFLFAVCFLSCKKENAKIVGQNPAPQIDTAKLTDSCFFSIDGTASVFNSIVENGKGNAAAKLDTSTKQYDKDTIQYYISCKLINSFSNSGELKIIFVKNFHKNQLPKDVGFGIMGPVSDTALYYPLGQHPYAVDYEGFNNQSGIVLNVFSPLVNPIDHLITYMYRSPYLGSTLNNNCQSDSKFEVTYVYKMPNGGYVLEARFTANLFDRYEKVKRLENGYLRMHLY